MNLMENYVEHGYALVPIPKGEKGPKVKGWNDRKNVVTDPKRAAAISGNVGIAHLYCEPSATAALDIDDFTLASKYLADPSADQAGGKRASINSKLAASKGLYGATHLANTAQKMNKAAIAAAAMAVLDCLKL